jgi:hypothetical protein
MLVIELTRVGVDCVGCSDCGRPLASGSIDVGVVGGCLSKGEIRVSI